MALPAKTKNKIALGGLVAFTGLVAYALATGKDLSQLAGPLQGLLKLVLTLAGVGGGSSE